MLGGLFVRRNTIAPLILACLLVSFIISPALAAPDDPPLKAGKSNLPTVVLQNQQGQQNQLLPVTHYLALGDSLAYGLQPNNDNTHGYVNDLSADLQGQGVTSHVDLGCPRETTSTFIAGGVCSYSLKSQLATALAYLQQIPTGQESLVTLDVGADDILDHVNINIQNKTCVADTSTFNTDLQTLDQNLTQTILPQLRAVLMDSNGQSTGNLVLLNYYDPFQNICPNTLSLIQTINTHLAHDIAGLGTLVDIFSAFGGSAIPNTNLCNYTWMCSVPPLGPDIHPTTQGYKVIANAIESQNVFQVNPNAIDGQNVFQADQNGIGNQNIFDLLNGLLVCKGKKGCKEQGND